MSNRHDHDELDHLLRDEGLGDRATLSGALREIRDGLEQPPAPTTVERHLAVITSAAREAAHRLPAPATASVGAPRPWGLRLRRALGLTAVKVAVGVGAAAAATGGGLAATGNLPDPAQQVVADVAERIGIDLPEPARPGPTTNDDRDTGHPAESRPPSTPPGRTGGAGSDRAETARPTAVPGRGPSEHGRRPEDDSAPGRAPTDDHEKAGDRANEPIGPPGKAGAARSDQSDPAESSGPEEDARPVDEAGGRGSDADSAPAPRSAAAVEKGQSALVLPMPTEDD